MIGVGLTSEGCRWPAGFDEPDAGVQHHVRRAAGRNAPIETERGLAGGTSGHTDGADRQSFPMTGSHSTAPTGDPFIQFCERCGTPVGSAAGSMRVGLKGCPSCGVYACGRCWARATRGCPGCGVPVGVAAGVGAAVERAGRSSKPPRARRGPIAVAGVATAVLAALVLAFSLGGRVRTAGEQDLALRVPAASLAPADGQSPSSSYGGSVEAATSSSGAPAPGRTSAPRIPTANPIPRLGTGEDGATPLATPQPASTNMPTPRPTPRPTFAPTPRPTFAPTPRPTACPLPAPQLVGERKANAAAIWNAAGFTGAVVTLTGNGNYVIFSQDLVAGRIYPCDASVTVGPPPPPEPH